LSLADRILAKHKADVWSFDKGYWNRENKPILQLAVDKAIMPKLGKKNKAEQEEEEQSRVFKKYKNLHSTVASNINELGHWGLDRCPGRGIGRYVGFIGLGVCAYNLKKMDKYLLDKEREKLKRNRLIFRQVA